MRKKFFIIIMTCLIGLAAWGSYSVVAINQSSNVSSTDETVQNNHSAYQNMLNSYIPKPVNILVLVKDRFSGCTDTMMVVNYKPETAEISVLSIPRDTKSFYHGRYNKINSAFNQGGQTLALSAVNSLLNMKIDKYMCLDLDLIRQVVDAVDGVYYNVPIRMKYKDRSQGLTINLKKGYQRLDGAMVEQLLRYRHPNKENYPKDFWKYYDGGDLTRLDNQQKFFREFFKQKANLSVLGKANQLIDALFKNIDTNFKMNDLIKLFSRAPELAKGKIRTFRIDGIDEGLPYYYYSYNQKIIDNSNKKKLSGKNVINKYFNIK